MAQFKTVDEYIDTFPKDVQSILETLRKTIKEEVSNAEEIISYSIPAIKQNGQFVIYFSAWKTHISLYPYTADMVKAFKESGDFKTSGKGTIQFPFDQPLPLSFIRKIVQFKVKEAQKRAVEKPKKKY